MPTLCALNRNNQYNEGQEKGYFLLFLQSLRGVTYVGLG